MFEHRDIRDYLNDMAGMLADIKNSPMVCHLRNSGMTGKLYML